MADELAAVLHTHLEELVAGTTHRLERRPEFIADRMQLAGQVRRCLLALEQSLGTGDTAELCAAALAVSRGGLEPAGGYRRAQLMLEAICQATADELHRRLPGPSSREALDGLRHALGPAQVSLVSVFRADETTGPPPVV